MLNTHQFHKFLIILGAQSRLFNIKGIQNSHFSGKSEQYFDMQVENIYQYKQYKNDL